MLVIKLTTKGEVCSFSTIVDRGDCLLDTRLKVIEVCFTTSLGGLSTVVKIIDFLSPVFGA